MIYLSYGFSIVNLLSIIFFWIFIGTSDLFKIIQESHCMIVLRLLLLLNLNL